MKISNPTIQKFCGKVWKHGPTIAVIAGSIGVGVGTFLTWRAARKHDAVVAEVNDILDEVRENRPTEVVDSETGESVTSEQMKEYRKELLKAYAKAGLKLGKLYALPLTVQLGSLSMILTGYGILNSRNSACVAACAVAENGLIKYRKRVVEALGEDADKEFFLGTKETEKEIPIFDKNGEPKFDKEGNQKFKKVKERTIEEDLDCYSTYARIFGKGCSSQAETESGTDINNIDYNMSFVQKKIDFLNTCIRYRPKRVVFLNEVYQNLGWEPIKAGQLVGWVYDENDPEPAIKYDITEFGPKNELIVDFYGLRNVLEYL